MSKSEIRNPKSEGSPRPETRNPIDQELANDFFGFRISDFLSRPAFSFPRNNRASRRSKFMARMGD